MPAPRKKFVELAEKRVSAALNALRLVGNLGNSNNYSYTDRDVEKIFRALTRGVNDAKAKFQPGPASGSSIFKLDE